MPNAENLFERLHSAGDLPESESNERTRRAIRLSRSILSPLAFALLVCGVSAGSDGIDFRERAKLEGRVSEDGAVTLSWSGEEGRAVRVEQSAAEDFSEASLRYEGEDAATVLTGLPEGVHYFRIGYADAETRSAPLAVEVRFVPRGRLFALLALGGAVVAATVGAILAGHRRAAREDGDPVAGGAGEGGEA